MALGALQGHVGRERQRTPARARARVLTRPLRIEEAEAGPNQGGYPYTRWAQDHNLNVGTVQERVTGRDKHGKRVEPKTPLVNGKLDLAGQRDLWEHYHTLPRFTNCSRCPHELLTDPEPETPAGSPRELAPTLPLRARSSSAGEE